MNLLLTGAWNGAGSALPDLERAGHVIKFLQHESEPLPCPYDWVEGVVCNGLFLHHPIEKFKSLQCIQLTSAGFDRIDMEYVSEHGIQIFNARGVYSIPMAEFALCGVLQLYKQAPFFHRLQRNRTWEKHRDLRELFGQTVCVIGCGSVGAECAKRFSAFGCTVIGVDLFPVPNDAFSDIFPMKEMHRALQRSDIVVLTLPLTKETFHLFDSEAFSFFKPGAILVNIARGAVVNPSALLNALNTNLLSGAVLDVFEEEPLASEDPLWALENVLITPHNSFVSNGNADRLKLIIYKNLKVI